MLPRINSVEHLGGYRLRLGFTDGASGEVDLADHITERKGVFLPLQDVGYFRQVQVDLDAGTIFWPNGVDFCPDVLCRLARETGTILEPA